MKKLCFLFFLTSISVASYCQTIIINGSLMDKEHRPISGANVLLIDSVTSTIIKAVKSNELGKFDLGLVSISESALKCCVLRISSIGYVTWSSAVIGKANPGGIISFDSIILKTDVKLLKEVSIQGQKNFLSQELDKYIYNVEDDPDSKSGKAMDIMYKISVLSIDDDRTIKMDGLPVTILVNGKPSVLFKRNLDVALKSMPANLIKRIEMNSNPSAKYDGDSKGAIINIVTKRKQLEGYTIDGGGSLSSQNIYVGTLSGSFKTERLAYSGEYTYWLQIPAFIKQSNTRVTLMNSLQTTSKRQNKGIYVSGYNNFSYEIDTLNLINLSLGLSKAKDSYDNSQMTKLLDAGQSVTSSYLSDNNGLLRASTPSVNLDYQRNFINEGEMLLISYRFNSDSGNDQNFYDRIGLVNYVDQYERSTNLTREKEHTGQIDYTLPFKNGGILETGLKYINRDNLSENIYLNFDPLQQIYVPNINLTNSFKFSQEIFSFYGVYGRQFKAFGLKLGLRGEQTLMNILLDQDSKVKNGFFNLIPTVFISRKLDSKSNISISYARRITRPGLYYLNPFINFQDPLNVSYGNPYLVPETTHSFEGSFAYNSWALFRTNFYYRFSDNAVESIASLEDGIINTTFKNVGFNRTLGGRISLDKRFKPITVSLSFNSTYFKVENPISVVGRTGFYYNPEIRLAFKILKKIRVTAINGYNSSRPTLQGKINSLFYNYVLLKRDFIKEKLAIGLSARNIIPKIFNRFQETISDDFTQSARYSYRQQEFKITLNYSIGALRTSLKRTQKSISNDDLKEAIKKSDVKKN